MPLTATSASALPSPALPPLPGMERMGGVFADPLRPHQRLGIKTIAILTGPLGYAALAQPIRAYPTMPGLAGGELLATERKATGPEGVGSMGSEGGVLTC